MSYRRRRVDAGLAALAGLMLVSCSGGDDADGPPVFGQTAELPTTEYRNEEDALIEGILRAEEHSGGVCVWIDSGTEPMPVRWPPGYRARVGELIEIVDESGATLAREGDRVRRGGGIHEDNLGACQRGDAGVAWWAGNLEVAN